ncbi:dihydrofolate reductase [Microvirga tunisiensis]|uniref:Dihydrofolate reductase n=1 Tax=Microvirga tunisiensis TaxID=2108360 RepID=A0A5N7MD21_9HYPH|nr:dihydrofolate reductase [Microvirga tunisiensis]MPR06446.1 dihydrofolate reductase [Microvirga tunisiensis]MPR24568.1 dihydrofolate reductase [Microvirga tunisiensis]
MTIPLILVVAVAENGVIGRDNQLLWRIKTDLGRFRRLTMGKPMIMGRKTFQSIGKPLPGRETIVLTRDAGFVAEGVHVVHTWEEAVAKGGELAARMGADAVAVAGGAEIYALALPQVQSIFLTRVQATPEGDALFPDFDRSQFRETRREDHPKGPDDEHPFTFIDLERRR